MKTLKKWPLLYRDSDHIDGKPHLGRVKAGGVSTRCIWENATGSESLEHIAEIQRYWPWLSAEKIRQAIRFENSRGQCAGQEKYD